MLCRIVTGQIVDTVKKQIWCTLESSLETTDYWVKNYKEDEQKIIGSLAHKVIKCMIKCAILIKKDSR
jgi:hypothetical protein